MLSLRKLIDQKNEGFMRYLKPLLLGISRHAVESDPEDLNQFRKSVEDVALGLTDSCSPEDVLIKIGVVLHALEEYNRRASRTSLSFRNEFRGILSVMTETIASVSASSRTSLEQLQSIEKNLHSATEVVELKLLRNKLVGCLALVRNESGRVRLESEQLVKSLKASVVRASTQTNPFLAGMPSDPATGLAGAEAAQQLIAKLLSEEKAVTVAMLVLDQLPGLNSRFGRPVGDEALLMTAQYLANELAEYGTLLRWNGPAFLLISDESQTAPDAVERRVKEIGGTRFDRDIKVDQRSVHFNITFSWTVHRVRSAESAEDVARKMDAFVSAKMG
jgi:GGDEF domain-containing protein